MKSYNYFSFLFLFFTVHAFSQNIPIIQVGEIHISVKKLKVDVTVIGDIAITTYDMHFYNPNNRVLEGELAFPLEENQSVIRFALGINGNLREAVVVEKEKARVAFETTVRTRIDPALLEKTKGNNYKARIYPIPAKGYKRVILAFQQKLLINNDAYLYKIPFNYKDKLENFSFKMNVLNQKNKPIIAKGFSNQFQKDIRKDMYFVKIKSKNNKINKPLMVKIPLNTNKKRVIANNEFFYFSQNLEFPKSTIELDNEITIFWDISLSQQYKMLKTEFNFLEAYFESVKNCKVNLVTFNTKVREEKFYNITNRNWSALKAKLSNLIYDGASSFQFLNDYQDQSKTHFLFTDGLNTLSKLNPNLKQKTHIINSSVKANHQNLKYIANVSGGNYINLKQSSIDDAFNKITSQQIQFLGTNIADEVIEVYPKKGAIIQQNFSLLGKGNLSKSKLKLFLGVGKDTLKTITVNLKNNSNNVFIPKLWAQKKLDYLSQHKEENENQIVSVSKKYQVISDITSLLVLDRVQDYVTHSIEPPKELKKEYDRLIVQKNDNKKERFNSLKNQLLRTYETFFAWYDKDYVFEKTKVKPKVQKSVTQITDTTRLTTTQLNTGFTVSGLVSDENGALPGVSVVVKDEHRGTETDFDGNYSLNVKLGDVLTFSYLGYLGKEITIGTSTSINISLAQDSSTLDEVVVVGYGTSRRTSVTGAVTTVRSERISNSLRGEVAGVTVLNANGQPGSLQKIVIRGTSSISTKNSPIYVVDGVVVTDLSKINPQEIASSYVLNNQQSSALYGNRAGNGVVVIKTKKGGRSNSKQIADFEKLVNQKIELKGWNPKVPYLKELQKIKNLQLAYQKYIEIRDNYKNTPSFYMDVADFFLSRNDKNSATQILTNVVEIDLDNYELSRALAYKFEEYKLYAYSVFMYEEILKLRPEDIQSYRDLALAYEHVGEYQKSVDLLYEIVNGELLLKDENRRFSGIETIALNEMNRMILKYKNQIKTNHIDSKYIKEIGADVKVVIDWNHNDTDIDLWVIDPNNEKCFYKHKKSKIGGLMSKDMTQGFGPEQFILKEAIDGNYKIKIKYYANSKQKISGPTFLKVTIFKNYAKQNEYKVTKLVRLKSKDEVLDIGKLVF